MDLITLFTGALATARLTRLITTDRITLAPRTWVQLRLDPDGLAAYLVTCDWCASVYVSAVVAAFTVWGPSWSVWVLAALAYSYTAGWLAAKESD